MEKFRENLAAIPAQRPAQICMTADPLSNHHYRPLRRHPYNGQGIGRSSIGAKSITSAIILSFAEDHGRKPMDACDGRTLRPSSAIADYGRRRPKLEERPAFAAEAAASAEWARRVLRRIPPKKGRIPRV